MTLLLADDDPLVTAALKTILSADSALEIVATGSSGEEAVELYRLHKPQVCLFDIRMKGKSGLQAAEEILAEDSEARILFLTTFQDDEYILKALHIGAAGYMLKQDFDRLVPAIYAAHAGQSILGSEITARLPALVRQKPPPDYRAYGIDGREGEIIGLVAEGLSNREIAEKIFLSEGTVRNYVSTVLDKLNLRDRTQLAVFHYKGGFDN